MPAPLFDPNRGFRVWNDSEIYVGPMGSATQAYVPNVDDMIIDWTLGTFRVVDVDMTTGLSVRQKQNLNDATGGLLEEDVLLGTGPGPVSQCYRVYVDTSTQPFNAQFDGRLKINAVNASYVKVFRGTNISSSGQVLSAILNTNGVVVSENIPLQLIQNVPGGNFAVKAPGPFTFLEALNDGDVVTAVTYTATGEKIHATKHIVVNTNFIRSLDAAQKNVVSIELITPYLSASDNTLIEIPVNMILQSTLFMGKVMYSDGTSILLPVDGTRFALQGVASYIATVVGQRKPLVLVYNLSASETAQNGQQVGGNRFVTAPYEVTTVEAQGIYSVKLFTVPVWKTAPSGHYELEWYLENLNRDVIYNVTPYVTYNTGSAVFDGAAIGTRQVINVGVNLADIGGSFNYYRQSQEVAITLLASGSVVNPTTYHTIEYTTGNLLGTGLKAILSDSATPGQYRLDLTNGFANYADFLAGTYLKSEPLYLTMSEGSPMEPTHYRVRLKGGYMVEVPVTSYANVLDNITEQPIQGEAVRLEFFRRTVTADLELAVVGLTITTAV